MTNDYRRFFERVDFFAFLEDFFVDFFLADFLPDFFFAFFAGRFLAALARLGEDLRLALAFFGLAAFSTFGFGALAGISTGAGGGSTSLNRESSAAASSSSSSSPKNLVIRVR